MSKTLSWLFPALILALIGCKKEETANLQEAPLEIDEALLPFFESFKEEAALRGVEVDYRAQKIQGLIQDIDGNNILGQCRVGTNGINRVIIDAGYWKRSDEMEKEFVIFHELGHCVLKRDHLDEANGSGICLSMMHSGSGECRFNYTPQNRSIYLDELFGN